MKRLNTTSCFTRCLLALPFLLSFTSCEKEDNNNPVTETVVNLSADEMANCYIVQKAGEYKLKADNQFNLGEGLPVPTEINPVAAGLVWQTEPGLIASVELKSDNDSPYIYFTVSKLVGNALLAVYDEEGKILWSWHIWMPQDKVSSVASDTGYEIMNMNLGAVNSIPGDASSYGMLYQWGRKDPFPASATQTGTQTTTGATLYDIEGNVVNITNSSWTDNSNNNMAYAIANPTVCMSNYSHYSQTRDWLAQSESNDSLWGNPNGDYRDSESNTYPNKGRKTCYDPSPAGWRVAPPDAFRNFSSTGGYVWDLSDFNVSDLNNDGKIDINDFIYGWNFNVSNTSTLYFPAASRYDGSYAMLMGSMSGYWGNYWSNSPASSMKGGAFCNLSFQTKDMNGNDVTTVSPSGSSSRADAFSVRCIRDNK